MRYWYDTEFLEDGKTIDLISIGIVAEDGREYYAVSNEFDTARVVKNEWLMKNVMSSIGYTVISQPLLSVDKRMAGLLSKDLLITDTSAKSREQIALDIINFIDDDAELWAWYGAYDHVALCQLFGKMIDLPNNIPMFTNDLKTLMKQAGNIKPPAQSNGSHNALDDARHNVIKYEFFTSLLT